MVRACPPTGVGAEVSAEYEYVGGELSPDAREVLLTVTVEAKQARRPVPGRGQAGGRVFHYGASGEDLKRLIGSFCPACCFPMHER